MKPVRLLPQARDELRMAAAHYESQRSGLGWALLAEFERSLNRLMQLPAAAMSVRGNFRRRIVRRFPYYIIYKVTEDEIVIVAVAHRRRRPGYWRERE